jgi:hypothetical protein
MGCAAPVPLPEFNVNPLFSEGFGGQNYRWLMMDRCGHCRRSWSELESPSVGSREAFATLRGSSNFRSLYEDEAAVPVDVAPLQSEQVTGRACQCAARTGSRDTSVGTSLRPYHEVCRFKNSRTISRRGRTDGPALALGRVGEASFDVVARQLGKILQDLGAPASRIESPRRRYHVESPRPGALIVVDE